MAKEDTRQTLDMFCFFTAKPIFFYSIFFLYNYAIACVSQKITYHTSACIWNKYTKSLESPFIFYSPSNGINFDFCRISIHKAYLNFFFSLQNFVGDSVEISFSKNGAEFGKAFVIEQSTLGEQALLPHILCKGCAFQVNFGQREAPWHAPPENFTFLKKFTDEDLTRTPSPPKTIEECEVSRIFVGLGFSLETKLIS